MLNPQLGDFFITKEGEIGKVVSKRLPNVKEKSVLLRVPDGREIIVTNKSLQICPLDKLPPDGRLPNDCYSSKSKYLFLKSVRRYFKESRLNNIKSRYYLAETLIKQVKEPLSMDHSTNSYLTFYLGIKQGILDEEIQLSLTSAKNRLLDPIYHQSNPIEFSKILELYPNFFIPTISQAKISDDSDRWTTDGGCDKLDILREELSKCHIDFDLLVESLQKSQLNRILRYRYDLENWMKNQGIDPRYSEESPLLWKKFFHALSSTVEDDYFQFQTLQREKLAFDWAKGYEKLLETLQPKLKQLQPLEILYSRKMTKRQRITIDLVGEHWTNIYLTHWDLGLSLLKTTVEQGLEEISTLAQEVDDQLDKEIRELEQRLRGLREKRDQILKLCSVCPVCEERSKETVICTRCQKYICIECYSQLDKCPFCRLHYSDRDSDELSSDVWSSSDSEF